MYPFNMSILSVFFSRNCWYHCKKTSASLVNTCRLSSRLATTAHQPWCCRCCWWTNCLHRLSCSWLKFRSSCEDKIIIEVCARSVKLLSSLSNYKTSSNKRWLTHAGTEDYIKLSTPAHNNNYGITKHKIHIPFQQVILQYQK